MHPSNDAEAMPTFVGDLPAIKCGVCEALMDAMHGKVASMREDAPFGKVRVYVCR